MVSAAIVQTLAQEFSIQEAEAERALALFASGLRAPYLARFRPTEFGGLPEGALRRLDRRRQPIIHLVELKTTAPEF